MKRSYISYIVGSGVLAASLAVVLLNLPAQAQTNAAPSQDGDRDFDWGWLRLAGLSCKCEEAVRYTEPNEMKLSDTDGTSNRY